MTKLFFIYIDAKPNVLESDIRKKMDLAIDWFKLSSHDWVVYTTSDEHRWFSRLENFVNPGGKLFICKLDPSQRYGWMNKQFWDWFDDKKKQHLINR